MNKFILSGVIFASLAFGISACNSADTGSVYTKATITHEGFDFSENKSKSDDSVRDGETVEWAPNTTYIEGEAYGDGIWFRPSKFDIDPTASYFYDTGKTDLDDVSSADASKWQKVDEGWAKLQEDHVYVFQALDGYVKLKVLSIDHDKLGWPIDAEYKFSKTKSF